MEPIDVTVEILRSIRDEVRDGLGAANQGIDQTNQRLEQANQRLERINERLEQTNERIDLMREELSRRIVESGMRTAAAITGLAGSIQDLTMLHDLRPRVERCEQEIESLKKRMDRR